MIDEGIVNIVKEAMIEKANSDLDRLNERNKSSVLGSEPRAISCGFKARHFN